MKQVINAVPSIPPKSDTESDEILRRFERALQDAAEIESRLFGAMNRLNYDEPEACGEGGCDTAKEPAVPPFESRINENVSALNRILCRIGRHTSRLERFV